jgi:hypothetical protein
MRVLYLSLLEIQKYLHFSYQYLYLSLYFSILWKVFADKNNVECYYVFQYLGYLFNGIFRNIPVGTLLESSVLYHSKED